MTDPTDVDSDRWVTLGEAIRLTRRSRVTIQRWARCGRVRTIVADGVTGFHLDDLTDTEATLHTNQATTRRVQW